jgi:hypothetical protein
VWCLTHNFSTALASVNAFIWEYSKRANLEINQYAELKRNYKDRVDPDDMNYKALSDLFVEIVICYYSYEGFNHYKKKFKKIFEQFQSIISSYIKEYVNNEFVDSKAILDVIKSNS